MQTIQKLLDNKCNVEVQMIGPEDTVFDAVTRMVELRIGALLVSENNVIVGIISRLAKIWRGAAVAGIATNAAINVRWRRLTAIGIMLIGNIRFRRCRQNDVALKLRRLTQLAASRCFGLIFLRLLFLVVLFVRFGLSRLRLHLLLQSTDLAAQQLLTDAQ